MLSNEEKRGCAALLRHLETDELINLAKTVTRMAIAITSRQEAINAIVSCTETPAEILNRKKILRDTLFKYLLDENVSVSSQACKFALAQTVCRHWGSTTEYFKAISDDSSRPAVLPVVSQQTSAQQPSINDTGLSLPSTFGSQPQTLSASGSESYELARQFTQWYYEMINSYHPSVTIPPTQYFGPQHFFTDCTVQMRLIGQNNEETFKKITGSQQVSIELLDLVRVNQLRFQPNTNADGLWSTMEPHGLVATTVCGTLHKNEKLVGLFEQRFGLAKDPSKQGNYIIKYTDLQCRETQMLK